MGCCVFADGWMQQAQQSHGGEIAWSMSSPTSSSACGTGLMMRRLAAAANVAKHPNTVLHQLKDRSLAMALHLHPAPSLICKAVLAVNAALMDRLIALATSAASLGDLAPDIDLKHQYS